MMWVWERGGVYILLKTLLPEFAFIQYYLPEFNICAELL